ncbi:MAG: dipeptidase [Candidatus Obscuribacterales bacterium]|nr:dipeptidase [Candidatus Obscuribacterales bacterium]
MFNAASGYWTLHASRLLDELKAFLRIPSISALPAHKSDVQAAADWVTNKLTSIGMEHVRTIDGGPDRHPLVYADWLHAPDKPTLLLYAHFDVQPVDPLTLWTSPPFEPTERNGKLFARGSADDKGQGFILLAVLEGFLKTAGKLPVNIKVLFEGEEESSGEHIEEYVNKHAAELGCSAAVVLDCGMYEAGLPTISTGLRGLIAAEVTVTGASRDLHSGEFGGAAPNSVQSLAEIIAKLKTPTGRVRIPGFYKQVKRPDKLELDSWARLPFDEHDYCVNHVGAAGLIGDRRYSVLHRTWALPTLEINGITGGFSGDGFKTVIPAVASAKISMRLVPDMDPQAVAKLFADYVRKVTPKHARVDVKILSASPAMRVETNNPLIQACAQAYKLTFGKDPAYVREGGSIPIAGTFKHVLNAPVLLTGFTLPDCNMHAPNENLDLANFHAGIQAIGRYFTLAGELNG